MTNQKPFHSGSLRLQRYDYSWAGVYFVTICTQDKQSIFGEIKAGGMFLNEAGRIVQQYWDCLPQRYPQLLLDEFIVMPDHVHGILIINDLISNCSDHDDSVGAIHELHLRNNPRDGATIRNELPLQDLSIPCNGFPSRYMRKRRKMLLPMVIGYFKMNTARDINCALNRSGSKIWQRNYYERIIRESDELFRVRQYIRNNPFK